MLNWNDRDVAGIGMKCIKLSNHLINYIERGPVLFITFFPDNMKETLPWGSKFIEAMGHSIIGIQYFERDWYRAKDLHSFMQSQDFLDFLAGFEKVVFYGASKGGYGALAFSSIMEKPIVLAIAAQSTLDPRLVPWEGRFLLGQAQDWDGDFRDAADLIKPEGRYHLIYDPFTADRLHAERIVGDNVFHHRLPFGGHLAPLTMRHINILKKTVELCRDGDLTVDGFARLARARRNHFSYYLRMRESRRTSEAVKKSCLERAAAMSPAAPEVIYELAVDAYRNKDWATAQGLFETIVERRHSSFMKEADHFLKRLKNGPSSSRADDETDQLLKRSFSEEF